MISVKNVITGTVNDKQSITGEIGSGIAYIIPPNMVTNAVVDELPEPSEKYRGHFRMIETEGNDDLYICLKVDGAFTWGKFSRSNKTSSALDEAILDMMILC